MAKKIRLRLLHLYGLFLMTLTMLSFTFMKISEIHFDNRLISPKNIPKDIHKCQDTLKNKKRSTIHLIDRPNKLIIMSTPKGGATLATQLMFRKLDLIEEALSYNRWIHKYRTAVFMKDPTHKYESSARLCPKHGWVCMKLVRSVFDRAVSSYIHIMKYSDLQEATHPLKLILKNDEKVKEATFVDFVLALVLHRDLGWDTTGDSHFMPQSDHENDYRDDVYLVPIETVGEALDALRLKTGVSLNATGLSSSHYIEKPLSSSKNAPDVALMRWSEIEKNKIPPYASFFLNPMLNKEICGLFCSDLVLYATACKSSWLRSSPETQKMCASERERTIAICGKEYDFYASS